MFLKLLIFELKVRKKWPKSSENDTLDLEESWPLHITQYQKMENTETQENI